MRQTRLLILVVIGGCICFAGYCVALTDWVSNVKTGVYRRNPVEGVWETSLLVVYSYLAIRFAKNRVIH